MKKSALRHAIIEQLQQELSRQASAAEVSRDEAISEESRAENKYDTHSQEAAYLAEGQAKLAGEIGESIKLYTTIPLPDFSMHDAIAIGAVVEIDAGSSGNPTTYFLGPRGGGLELQHDGRQILVLTPQSPLGRQLLGKRVGDFISPSAKGRGAVHRIVGVG